MICLSLRRSSGPKCHAYGTLLNVLMYCVGHEQLQYDPECLMYVSIEFPHFGVCLSEVAPIGRWSLTEVPLYIVYKLCIIIWFNTGPKFWKSPKLIKAVRMDQYSRLKMRPKRPNKAIDSSSSDSDIEDPRSTPMSKRRAIPADEPSWIGILSSKLDYQTQILKKIQSTKITVHLKEILSCVVCKEIGIKKWCRAQVL